MRTAHAASIMATDACPDGVPEDGLLCVWTCVSDVHTSTAAAICARPASSSCELLTSRMRNEAHCMSDTMPSAEIPVSENDANTKLPSDAMAAMSVSWPVRDNLRLHSDKLSVSF